MKIAAIIQARLGSTRLPMKSLLTLRGLPLIDWVATRVSKARRVDEVIVAIPDTPLDDALAAHLESRKINFIRGPEGDVLKRFAMASEQTGADHIVRVCADNPLIWWEAIDRLIEFYQASGCDYAWNHVPRQNHWPDGLGAEITSAAILRQMDMEAREPMQREHCFNYIWDNQQKFRMGTFDPAEEWLRKPKLRLDIDSPQDFRKLALAPISPDMDARKIVAAFAPEE